MPRSLTPEQDALAISVIRGLAMDAPLAAKSGHQGTAMSLAPLAHVLYSRVMKHDPSNPQWFDRDRFILSNGHASILQYALLFLSGYGLEMPDLKAFRQWDSLTPGHPEAGHTAGVEVTTGPLGQGFANAVGMAIAESHLRATLGKTACDHRTWVIAGDGCLMEGISHEAASLAGHLKLDHLIVIFDDNKITIDGHIDLTCSDDVPGRFRSYGWNVIEAGSIADDCDALEHVLTQAAAHSGAPTLICLRTHIGTPSPDFTDKHEAHGNPFTAEHVSATKRVMGIPDEPFYAPSDLVTAYRNHCVRRATEWVSAWEKALSKDQKDRLAQINAGIDTAGVRSLLPDFADTDTPATRVAFQKVLDATRAALPTLIAGAADLTGNTGAKLSEPAFSGQNPSGRQVFYGIREHAMGAAMVGMAQHGGVVAVGGTFFVFADYMRPAIRLAALSHARCVFVFSHDSVGVGEDGPTHQPIEQLASLRAMPGLQIIRPADARETSAAWVAALEYNGPTALILSRQNLPLITDGSAVERGAGIVIDATQPRAVIAATGSEVSIACDAARLLNDSGIAVRVVSLPSWDRLERAGKSHQQACFPDGIPVVSIEAGTTFGWSRWADLSLGIDRFGASAPGSTVMEKYGMSSAAIVDAVKAILSA